MTDPTPAAPRTENAGHIEVSHIEAGCPKCGTRIYVDIDREPEPVGAAPLDVDAAEALRRVMPYICIPGTREARDDWREAEALARSVLARLTSTEGGAMNRFRRDALTRLNAAVLDLTAAGMYTEANDVLELIRRIEPAVPPAAEGAPAPGGVERTRRSAPPTDA